MPKSKKSWYERNKARHRASVDAWNERNTERLQVTRRAWRQKNKRRIRDVGLRYRFGVGIEDYERMLKRQRGGCAICRKPPLPEKMLCVDHDHKTGRVRGLLCRLCNWYIGHIEEDRRSLQRAVDYLKKV